MCFFIFLFVIYSITFVLVSKYIKIYEFLYSFVYFVHISLLGILTVSIQGETKKILKGYKPLQTIVYLDPVSWCVLYEI